MALLGSGIKAVDFKFLPFGSCISGQIKMAHRVRALQRTLLTVIYMTRALAYREPCLIHTLTMCMLNGPVS